MIIVIIKNCKKKLDSLFINNIKIGVIVVFKNNINVLIDKKKFWLFLIIIFIFEIIVGIVNVIFVINNILNVVISIIFVVIFMSMIDIIYVVNVIVSKCFIFIWLFICFVNRDNNMFIILNNFIIEDIDMFFLIWCDVIYLFKILYIFINIISNVSEINK